MKTEAINLKLSDLRLQLKIRQKEGYRQFGRAVKKAREEASLTQEGLAEKIGMSRPSVAKIENGQQQVLLHTAIEIAEVLGITLSKLFDFNNTRSED